MENHNTLVPTEPFPRHRRRRLVRIDTPPRWRCGWSGCPRRAGCHRGYYLYLKAEATAKLMRLLREIHEDEVLVKRQQDLEERLLVLQERLEAYEKRRLLQ